MPKKKKGFKKNSGQDFTINDCANAPKPVTRVKKSTAVEPVPEVSWDEIDPNDFDITEEVNADGSKNIAFMRKKQHSKSELDNFDGRPGIVYPEIVWYLISHHIKPEQIGCFAGLTKAAYAVTKRKSFWNSLYHKYCENNPNLPENLRLDRTYGLRQRVIRALYHTYDIFIYKAALQVLHDSRPYDLVKRRCVNIWYFKVSSYWSVYFKFKKIYPFAKVETVGLNFLEEISRIDANREEDCKVLLVNCQSISVIPPIMGMTLSSVNLLSQGFRQHRLQLGFTSSHYNISRDTLPDYHILMDTVVNMYVFDWWHPKYPDFDTTYLLNMPNDEWIPLLQEFYDGR